MADVKKNTWGSKLKRTLTAVLPVSKKRGGSCIRCGECCKLPNKCFFLRQKDDGSYYCTIHKLRPLNCRKYPRVENEFITKDTCGYSFR